LAATTPDLAGESSLGALDARYVTIDALPWRPTRWEGIRMKVLMEDKDKGLLTALMQWDPGTRLPLHEHVRIEQTYVLEGSLEDSEGVATAGNFVWRPEGSQHVASAPNGALILAFFLQPNRFFETNETLR
jgi:anti-sigma factor ChrR (cupin superfamily)